MEPMQNKVTEGGAQAKWKRNDTKGDRVWDSSVWVGHERGQKAL